MLSSVLRSDIAVQTSVLITRAFVAMRQMIANSPVIMSAQHQKEMKELKEYIEDVFADQNDINEDTRMQIELINQVLAELQVHKKLSEKPRRPGPPFADSYRIHDGYRTSVPGIAYIDNPQNVGQTVIFHISRKASVYLYPIIFFIPITYSACLQMKFSVPDIRM